MTKFELLFSVLGKAETAAASLAFDAHDGQSRKFTGEPYIVHPFQVYKKLLDFIVYRQWPSDIQHVESLRHDMLCAALLHDVLEDCPQISEQQIIDATNENVLNIVKQLTNPSKDSTAPRAVRKQMDRDHLKEVSQPAKIIKLVDRIVNLQDMQKCPDKGFVKLYASESRLLLECLAGTDAQLEDELLSIIKEIEWSEAARKSLASSVKADSINLKKILMELGNTLVTKHGYHPHPFPDVATTSPIVVFTDWLNSRPEAREVLAEMGVDWPVVEKK